MHPTAFTYCTTGATAGTPTENYAIIHRNRDSTVSSDVELKDASPNATYTVFFVQTPIFNHANCFTSVGTIQTNSQGNGRAHFSEALLSGQTGAFVNMFGPDGFQATPNYVFGDK